MHVNAGHTKIHYQGNNDDFIIIAESGKAVRDWKKDKSIPLAQVVNGWNIFVTHKQGAQGIMDAASNAALDNEFGTHREEDVVAQILERGAIMGGAETGGHMGKNESDRNITKGPMIGTGSRYGHVHG